MKIYTSTQEEQTRLAIVVSFISNLFITREVIWVWYIKHVQDDAWSICHLVTFLKRSQVRRPKSCFLPIKQVKGLLLLIGRMDIISFVSKNDDNALY